jgi:hypothetical protein
VTRQITYLLLGDGGTDRALVPIVEWAIHRLDPGVDILEPEFRKRSGSVADFLRAFRTGAMLVFVHRDAESEGYEKRVAEFASSLPGNVVPVIPVRMTEAWLLSDAAAIARAADRPEARVIVPPLDRLEDVPDPKQLLESLLIEAASLTGRRRKLFVSSIVKRRVAVAELTTDFGRLEKLVAFRNFQQALRDAYPYRSEVKNP